MSDAGFKAKWRRLSLSQKLTLTLAAGSFLASVASVGVAVVAVMVASNTKDIKAAIANLSDLATQTKRQADNTSGQLIALQDQVGEAKAQTKAISAQTDAIKNSSDANIKAATAQQRMADVTAKAQTPNIDLSELRVDGLKGAPEDGWVPIKLFWRFRNTGGSALTTKKVMYGLTTGKTLPDRMPDGAEFNGQDVSVTPTITSAFAPGAPIELKLRADARDAVAKGDLTLFFYARYYYQDGLGADHFRCFGRQIILKDGDFYFHVPSGGPSYKCAT